MRLRLNCLLSLLGRDELKEHNMPSSPGMCMAVPHQCCSHSLLLLNCGDSSLCHPRCRYLHEEVHEKRCRDKVLRLRERPCSPDPRWHRVHSVSVASKRTFFFHWTSLAENRHTGGRDQGETDPALPAFPSQWRPFSAHLPLFCCFCEKDQRVNYPKHRVLDEAGKPFNSSDGGIFAPHLTHTARNVIIKLISLWKWCHYESKMSL